MRRATLVLLVMWVWVGACLPADRPPAPPAPTVVIPPPVPVAGEGFPAPGGNPSDAASKLPTQPPAGQGPRADVDGRLLVSTTRASPRRQSDIPADYRLAWWSRAGLQPVPLPDDERGVLDAAARPGGGMIVAIVGGTSLLRAADDGSGASELLPRLNGLQPTHVESYLSVAWAGRDRVLVRQTPPAGISLLDWNGQSRSTIALIGLNPAPAPDGQHLALGYAGSHNFYSIFIADQPFAAVRKLTGDDILEAMPAWSQDGAWLAYAAHIAGSERPGWALRVVRPDGTNEQTIIPGQPGMSYSTLRWSPDGKEIAFTRYDEAARSRQIGVVNRDGSHAVILSDGASNDRVLDWVP